VKCPRFISKESEKTKTKTAATKQESQRRNKNTNAARLEWFGGWGHKKFVGSIWREPLPLKKGSGERGRAGVKSCTGATVIAKAKSKK